MKYGTAPLRSAPEKSSRGQGEEQDEQEEAGEGGGAMGAFGAFED